MNPVSTFTPPPAGGYFLAQSAQQSFSLSALTMVNKNIVLETEEGDRVSISSESRDALRSESQQRFERVSSSPPAHLNNAETPAPAPRPPLLPGFYEQEQSFSRDLFAFSHQSSFRIEIEGDLNAEEQADIRQALAKIDEIMTAALTGEDPTALAADASELLKLDTISTIEADYRYRSVVVIESRQNYSAAGSDAGGGLGSRQPDPVAADERIQELIDKMTAALDEARENGVMPERLRSPVEKLFDYYQQTLAEAREQTERRELLERLDHGLNRWFDQQNNGIKI